MLPRHLYVHVPFCARRCSYCDFAIAVRRVVPVDEYLLALEREIDIRFAPSADAPWHLDTLYLGGGTPSLLGASGIARLLDIVRSRATLHARAEVTVEANPDDVTPEAVRAWRAAGVNRLSLGGQSFDDAALRWMHRTHDAARIRLAVENAREAELSNLSLDLIFSLPEELGRDWRRDLDLALELEPPHVSLYGLTVESGTPLGRWVARGEVVEAPEERYEHDFLLADRMLTSAGFEHYEVSNFARPGVRARHNSAYWEGRPYAGIGPSAHGFDGAVRRWNAESYADWERRIAGGLDPMEGQELLDDENRLVEQVYLGLRTSAGLPIATDEAGYFGRWVLERWAVMSPDLRLRLTPSGWLRLDALAADLTAFRSRS